MAQAAAALKKTSLITGKTYLEFHGNFLVYPDSPLPEYNARGALAFQAGERNSSNESLYALIYHPHTPPRINVLDGLKTITDTNMLTLLDWGLIDWPQPVSRRLCVICPKNPGKPFSVDPHEHFEPFSEDELDEGIIEPCYRIFEAFALRGFTYRALRTSNIFITDKGRRHLLLGQNIDYYPAFHQSALFEPVESALTMPCARGEGTIGDDLYSLGVLMAILTLGYHPLHDLTEEEVIQQKLTSGSFGAIIGNRKISVSLLEPIKGLLIDDPYDRWALKDLKNWIDGRRLNARQPVVPKRATRPYVFEDKEHYYLDTLLLSLMHNSGKGMTVFKNPGFHHWLKRSLGMENLSLDLEAQYEKLIKSGGGGTPEKLTSRLLMAVNPLLPIFFKGLSFQIKGIGEALAYFFDKQDNRQITAEVIGSRLPTHWIGAQKKALLSNTKMLDIFEKSPRIIASNELGMGIERTLYDLNPHFPCISPLFRDIAVLNTDNLLLSLEEIVPQYIGKTEPYDKHIVAFVASRGHAIGDAMVASFRRDLMNHNPALAVLKFYAQLQKQLLKKNIRASLPNLAKWILSYSPEGVVSYKNIERQKTIQKKLEDLTVQGDLTRLLEAADDAITALRDRQEYNEARKFYTEITSFISLLEQEKQHIDKISFMIGSRISAILSTGMSVIATLIILFNFL